MAQISQQGIFEYKDGSFDACSLEFLSGLNVQIAGTLETTVPDWMAKPLPRHIEMRAGKQWWREHYEFEAYVTQDLIHEDATCNVSVKLATIPGTVKDISNMSLLARFLRWGYRILGKVKHD